MDSRGIWYNGEFRSYMGATAFSGLAISMQQLLLAWVLIGILELPADQVGLIQAVTGIPGIFLMLIGGASADRRDPRSLLIRVYAYAPILPGLLVAAVWFGMLNVYSVLLWALGMSVVSAYTSPAQQAILNRIAGADVQKAISASTAIGYLVQMGGLALAGQIDTIGLAPVLLAQGACIGLGAVTVRMIRPIEQTIEENPEPMIRVIGAGLGEVYRQKQILHVLVINFVSSIFNAGAFMTVFPFIVKRIYEGDALLLATLMIVFYGCAMVSNLIMWRLMPFVRPGRLFLILQLSRTLILGLLWVEPDFWLMVVATIAWGFNMGVTTTLARAIVQESAEPAFRARILSVYSLGLLGSAPVGAVILGTIIESFGTLNALVPGVFISILLFLSGITMTSLYRYESPESGNTV